MMVGTFADTSIYHREPAAAGLIGQRPLAADGMVVEVNVSGTDVAHRSTINATSERQSLDDAPEETSAL